MHDERESWASQLSLSWSFVLVCGSLLDDPFEKIDADGLFVVPGEDAFAEALDHAGLANGAVAHNHHLLQRSKELKNENEEKKR